MSHQIGSGADALHLNVYEGHKTDKQLALELNVKNHSYYGCNDCASSDMMAAQRRVDSVIFAGIHVSNQMAGFDRQFQLGSLFSGIRQVVLSFVMKRGFNIP
jgi:hypothetical protein